MLTAIDELVMVSNDSLSSAVLITSADAQIACRGRQRTTCCCLGGAWRTPAASSGGAS